MPSTREFVPGSRRPRRVRHRRVAFSPMRSLLILRSPSDGTGWQDRFALSGRDERIVRDALSQLGEFRVDPPIERWDPARGHVIQADDRWLAAMLLHPDEPTRQSYGLLPPPAEAAWTAAGALRLAELLPEAFDDVRTAIAQRFGSPPGA
jgi:hypothetical protein